MDEKYRLVFRGEILEGQHRTVVKRRIMELMSLSESQLEKLFSGDTVIIKSDADRKTAAKYQTMFKQAGGRLRILTKNSAPADTTSQEHSAPSDSAASAEAMSDRPAATSSRAAPGEEPALTVLTGYSPPPVEPRTEIEAPNYGLAEVGARLVDEVSEAPVAIPEPDFELADVGVDLLIDPPEAVVVEVREVEFGLAEPGATLGLDSEPVAAPAPDISHLKLVEL